MPTGFTEDEQEKIKEALFLAGIRLIRKYGVQRTTIDKLTKECGIAKGSFYLFYSSKEEYLAALSQYTGMKCQEMLLRKLAGRKQMTVKEFFEFFREYIYSDYDLMGCMTIDDFLWLKSRMSEQHFFDPARITLVMQGFLDLISDKRNDVNPGVVTNLVKSIYAMREHRDTFVAEALDDSIELILQTLAEYISGSRY